MRRIRAALWIFGIVAILAVFSHFTVRNITNTLDAHLQDIRIAGEQEDYASAKEAAVAMTDYLESHKHWLELFIKRESVASISVNLHGLTAYANEECVNDLLNEVDKSAKQVEMLEHLFFSVF